MAKKKEKALKPQVETYGKPRIYQRHNRPFDPLATYRFTKTELRREVDFERQRHKTLEMDPPSVSAIRRELQRYA